MEIEQNNMFQGGLVDPKYLIKFNYKLENSQTKQEKLHNIEVLLNSSQNIIDKFTQGKGFKIMNNIFNKACGQLDSNLDLIDLLLQLLNKMQLNTQQVDDLYDDFIYVQKKKDIMSESLKKRIHQFYNKWRRDLDDFYFKSKNDKKHDRKRDQKRDSHDRSHYDDYDKNKKKRKSRSKSRSLSKKKSKTILFHQDRIIQQIKFFFLNDEPNKEGATQKEINDYRKQNENQFQNDFSLIQHREAIQEGKNMKQRIDIDKEQQDKFNQMSEQIQWYKPLSFKKIEQTQLGTESKQKLIFQERIDLKIMCYYVSDSMIPDSPNINILNTELNNLSTKKLQIKGASKPVTIQKIDSQSDIQTKVLPKKEKIVLKSILKKPKGQQEKDKNEDSLEEKKEQDSKKYIDPQLIQKLIELQKASQSGQDTDQLKKEMENVVKELKNYDQNIVQQMLINMKNIQDSKKDNASIQNQNLLQNKLQMNYGSKMNLQKYKTVACRLYQSPSGCPRGNNCHFIHDQEDQTKFKQNNLQNNLLFNQTQTPSGITIPNLQNIINQPNTLLLQPNFNIFNNNYNQFPIFQPPNLLKNIKKEND